MVPGYTPSWSSAELYSVTSSFFFEVRWLESRPGVGDGDGGSVPLVGLPPTDLQLLSNFPSTILVAVSLTVFLLAARHSVSLNNKEIQKQGPTAAPKTRVCRRYGVAPLTRKHLRDAILPGRASALVSDATQKASRHILKQVSVILSSVLFQSRYITRNRIDRIKTSLVDI